MPWIPIAAAGIGALGSIIGGNATASAQNKANDLAAQQAAAQNQQLWNQYLLSRGINPGGISGIPGSAGGSVNTVLPIGANINGTPAEQWILNAIGGMNKPAINGSDPAVYTSAENIAAFFKAHPEVRDEIVNNMAGSDDTRTPEQWLHDHVTQTEAKDQPDGSGTFTSYLRNFATQANAVKPGAAITNQVNTTLPQNILDAQNSALGSVGNVYNGGFLNHEFAALTPIADARNALAALQGQKNTEMRAGAKNVLDTQLSGLDSLFGTRNQSADNILNTTLAGLDPVLNARNAQAASIYAAGAGGLKNIRGAKETGANNIYGAELTNADTYANAVDQAVARTMATNRASRAIRGFGGDSSTDALLNARTLAGGYQQSAGARGQAGVNLQNRLSDARVGEQQGLLGFGTQRAQQTGEASIQDALSRLLANTTNATQHGSASEQDALGRLSANTGYANTLSGILDSNAAAAVQNANLQNAGDYASLIGNDITRQLGNVGTAGNIYGQTLNLNNQAANSQYASLNAMLGALGFLRQGQTPTPTPVQPNIGSVLSGGQIAGSALSGIGSSIQNQFNTQQLLALLNRPVGGGSNSGSGLNV